MAIAFVQAVGNASSATSGNTLAVTVPAGGVAVGDTLVLYVGFSGGTGLANATAADNHAGSTNVYTNQAQVDDTSTTGCYSAIITCPVTTALVSGDVITVTYPTNVTHRTLFIDEFSGVDTSSPIDTTGTGNAGASGTSTSSASVTTTNAADLIVGATVMVNTSTLIWFDTSSPGTWTSSQITSSSTGRRAVRSFQIVSATNTYTVSGSLSTAELWSCAVVALKAAGAGPATQTVDPVGIAKPTSLVVANTIH